jgi:hypothetical protein
MHESPDQKGVVCLVGEEEIGLRSFERVKRLGNPGRKVSSRPDWRFKRQATLSRAGGYREFKGERGKRRGFWMQRGRLVPVEVGLGVL